MRTLALVGLTLTVAVSSLAAQADTMKKASPKSCCAGMAAGGMQHGGGMMGGMDHMRMGQMGMGQGGMGGMDGMMGPMGKVMAFDPEHVLAAKDKLQLTDQQVTRLTALRDAGKKTADDAHQPAHAAMQTLMKELESAAPDTTKVRQLFMAHGTGMANVTWAKASTAFQARAVLTEIQRGRVEGMHDAMQGGHMMQHEHMMQHDGMQGMEHPAKP
jgi:hypothetical protein